MTIHPIILGGGQGTRLWPTSRKTFPKQFAPFLGARTPYQEMLTRLAGEGFGAPMVATTEEFRFLAMDQARAAGAWDTSVLVEPEGRGTAAAVLLAALKSDADPDALLFITGINHFAGSAAAFREAVRAGAEVARTGKLVTFSGAAAEETGLKTVARVGGRAIRIVEPDEAGGHGGDEGARMGLIRKSDLIAAYKAHAPELLEQCRRALESGKAEHGFFRYGGEAIAEMEVRSFADTVVDKLPGARSLTLGAACSDLGGWDAVWELLPRDARGVATSGAATAVDCDDSLLRCDEPSMRVLGVGLKNVVAVAMRDGVLVADRSKLAEIPGALEQLAAEDRVMAEEYPRYHRPWGWYESLVVGERFQVKRICVKPGGVLSLQSHVHRAEHWVVVGGTAEVTVGEEVKMVPENGCVYIPIGAVHRMANPGKVPMYLIEVQTGAYLGEDDIKRYEDIYDRC
ncbi:sugar phosphate nucleotidyltransferase [Vannielia sp. SX4]|uniref:sugar phosphate nucleotidyltransferase n=1 Tax=Vannielia sp. SX4 TaxID=3463852 RepID=UPI00405806B3